jgi:hypothetical protein
VTNTTQLCGQLMVQLKLQLCSTILQLAECRLLALPRCCCSFCSRFLQGEGTDQKEVSKLRKAIQEGVPVSVRWAWGGEG